MDFNPNIINLFIEAPTKEELVQLQFVNNAINGKAFNYQTPQKDGNSYVVWFYANINDYKKVSVENLKNTMPTDKNLTELIQESK